MPKCVGWKKQIEPILHAQKLRKVDSSVLNILNVWVSGPESFI